MIVRTRYAPKPTRRRARRDDTRRAILITITFVAAIAVALSLVAGVFVANYYADHGAAVESVNGEAINKDAVRDRVALNVSRDKRLVQDYLVLRNQGKITPDEYSAVSSTPLSDQTSATLYTDAAKQLATEATLRQYASKHGITVSDQQIKAQIQIDGTVPEMRHVMIIGVAAVPTPPASSVTAQDAQDALNKAQGYLDEVKSGKKWADVATESNGTSSGATTDLGLAIKDSMSLDPDLVDAIFNLAKPNDLTAIFKGTDGIYRFATVTSIVSPYVDADWEKSMSGDFQGHIRAAALQTAVQDSVNKQYVDTPTVQRHVLEIAVGTGYGQPGNGDEVKISMMAFAPSHNAAAAAQVPTSDAAWADAKSRADAAVATLRADPSKFDAMAKDTSVNDDTVWSNIGGSLPWIPADLFNAQTADGSTGLGLTNVATAVFKNPLTPNTIIDPVQETSEGYIVVKFEGRRPAPAQRIADAQLSIAAGADFATVAKETSEVIDATEGGDKGWGARYQFPTEQEQAIFSTPVGGVSQLVSGNGYYAIYKVVEEQTRLPDPAVAATLKKSAFGRWLTELGSNTNIWTDDAGITALSPASPTP